MLSLEGQGVRSAEFPAPDPTQVGDFQACRLFREALRVRSRSGAGPFRSLSRIAVTPRPYQMVPLLLALKQETVRLLVADDVGVGKTVEAGLIARELLDRGEIRSFAVICPPHLADQWQKELDRWFHLDTELVLSSTINALERGLPQYESVFNRYTRLIVSIDFIKTEARRSQFLSHAPDLIIVDEAHTCAVSGEGRSGRHYRHEFIKSLVDEAKSRGGASRHLILLTATPHSGKDDAFRSLLGLLNDEFRELPEDLGGAGNEGLRRRLAEHFIQRRRANIERLIENTPFPKREEREETYSLTGEYEAFFEKVLDEAAKKIQKPEGDAFRSRLNWWSALALLRSLASSPAAAAETLRNRARSGAGSTADLDQVGETNLLDVDADDVEGQSDTPLGADTSPESERRGDPALLALAREADGLCGVKDSKLQKLIVMVKGLLAQKHHPIIFCRYIPTATYVAKELRRALGDKVSLECVTGLLDPNDREERISEMGAKEKVGRPRVLVATDCLSEGINLQELFDAVVHYDLSWNPTRHEQREGRVDRYGQATKLVRIITYYGKDNPVDGLVLEVLLRKHAEIRRKTGVGVNVPHDSEGVVASIMEGLLLRRKSGGSRQDLLPGLEDLWKPQAKALHATWEKTGEKEGRLRTMFAQEAIKIDDLKVELAAAQKAGGTIPELAAFVRDTVRLHGGTAEERDGDWTLDYKETPPELVDRLESYGDPRNRRVVVRYERPVKDGVLLLAGTHPMVEEIAGFVSESALDGIESSKARRAGTMRTKAVSKRSTILLLRFRHDLVTTFRDLGPQTQLAEELGVMAFEGAPEAAQWLSQDQAEALWQAQPSGNVGAGHAEDFVAKVVQGLGALKGAIEGEATKRAEDLREAHSRVRRVSAVKGRPPRIQGYKVEPRLRVDVLGIYILLPHVA